MLRILFATAARTLTDRKGVTAAEYAVLATGIVVGLAVAVTAFSDRLKAAFGGLTF